MLFAQINVVANIEEKRTMGLKVNFSNHGLMVRLNLGLDNVRNCEETTKFMKRSKKNIKCKNKGILILACKQGLL